MHVVPAAILALIEFINFLDAVLQAVGIKLCKFTRENVLRGLPEGAEEELQKPDIKKFADALLEDSEVASKLNLVWRVFHRILLRDQIKGRLEIKDTIEKMPEIKMVTFTKPVYIVGHFRTGTTHLLWLLHCDKQFRSPLMWEQMMPCPPGPVADYTKDPRFLHLKQTEGLYKILAAEHYATHPTEINRPEECAILFNKLEPALDTFLNDKETAKHLYDYYYMQLQILCWGHDMASKRYLGKSPYHQLFIEELSDHFPDATFVYTYRPLTEVVPSCMSLFKYFHEPMGFKTDTERWRKRFLDISRTMLTRGLKSLEKCEQRGMKVYFLSYKDLVSDPMGEVRKLYDFLGMNLTLEAESAMINYLNNDPKKNVYGKQVYKKGSHFSKEFIEKEFKEYIDLMSKRFKREDII